MNDQNPNLGPQFKTKPFRQLDSRLDGWAGDLNGGRPGIDKMRPAAGPTKKMPKTGKFRPKDDLFPGKN